MNKNTARILFLSPGGGPLPLFVCYGMARRACSEYFALEILHKKARFYLW
jgi:hypothetical protein